MRTRAALLVLLAIVAGAAATGAARSAPDCDASRSGWASAEAPGAVRALAPLTDGRLLATDDRALYSSAAIGCGWKELWRVPDVPDPEFPYVTERIAGLATAGDRLYMVSTGPHFLSSLDGGRTWAVRDEGLRAGGVPNELVIGSPDGRVVYMTVNVDVSDEVLNNGVTPSQGVTVTSTLLYRSRNYGASWQLVVAPYSIFGPRGSGVAAGGEPGTIWDLKVDPTDADVVWAATNEGLFTSAAGGSGWTAVISNGPADGPDLRALDIARSPGTPGTVTAIEPSTGTVYRSVNGGAGPWATSSFPGLRTVYGNQALDPMVWLARGRDAGPLIASGPKGVFLDAGSSWTDISPLSLGSGYTGTLVAPTADPSSPTVFWGRERTGATIYRYSIPAAATQETNSAARPGSPARLDALSVPPPSIGALASPLPARLSPRRGRILLRPGESTERTYHLDLPPRPTPLDVFFLLDSTASMSDVIRALARSVGTIATRLRAQGIDVWAGLGQFRTYPLPGEERFAGEPYHFAYRRDLDLMEPGRALARALLEIEGAGQSGANLTALHQAVTGAGQDVVPPGPSGADVPPELDATFRPDALKVIVHAADTWFATPERGDPNQKYPPGTWPGPGFEAAAGALAGAGVHHVGIAVGESNRRAERTGSPNVFDDLAAVSERTSTFASRGGVDCDGDGGRDLRPDEPLVCGLTYERVAPSLAAAVAGLLASVSDVGPVRLVETTDSAAVESIDPPVVSDVDLRAHSRLHFDVTYTCPPATTRDRFDVELSAVVRDRAVARANTIVYCRRVSPPAQTLERPDAQVAVVVVPAPAPPPPVQGAPGTAPANAPAAAAEPAPAPAQVPAAHPQAVPVAQRQVQPQLAFVHAVQQVRQQVEMEHAMVRFSAARSDPLETVKYGLATGAVSMLLLWGMATAVVRTPAEATRTPRRVR